MVRTARAKDKGSQLGSPFLHRDSIHSKAKALRMDLKSISIVNLSFIN